MSRGAALGVVFAGGGTGGHIQPNLAIAEELALLLPGNVRGIFVTSEREIDAKVLAAESIDGFEFEQLVSPAKPIAMKPMAAVRFVWHWGSSVRAGRAAIAKLRESCDNVVLVSTGGFVSPGAAMGARAEGVPSVLVNLDAVPGKANRLMMRWATRMLSSAPISDARLSRIAPIVRRRMSSLPDRADAIRQWGLDEGKRTLFVTGGSQGSSTINTFVTAALGQLGDEIDLDGWQVLHQCGRDAEAQLVEAYGSLGVQASVHAYIDRMDRAFAAADAVVTRGGAGAMSDVWATATPALVLPYPYHADEHQRQNAAELEAAGGVSVGTDKIDTAANLSVNLGRLRSLMIDSERSAMSVAFERLGPADGALAAARTVLELAGINSDSE